MKNGLLALMLLSIVAAIPACRQRDCLDKDRGCEQDAILVDGSNANQNVKKKNQ